MSDGAGFWAETYPERADRRRSAIARSGHAVQGLLPGGRADRSLPGIVRARQQRLQGLSDSALRAEARALRLPLRQALGAAGKSAGPALGAARSRGCSDAEAEAFALVREASRRALGMQHFDCQLQAGTALLRGRIVEMQTGEGKTLAATLAAGTQALAGLPVHVITANDYLAARDAAWMRDVYALLGLAVGTVVAGTAEAARRAAYAADVTYCCNKEIVFDYLRDRVALGRLDPATLQFERLLGRHARRPAPLLRGLCVAIVDEADSVLIDETRTPLILSRQVDGERDEEIEAQAIRLAGRLEADRDYRCLPLAGRVELSDAGRARLAAMAEPLGGVFARRRWREQLITRAIAALELYHRDEDYLVRDGEVQLIDAHTGRVTPGRTWSQGLQQLIEAKEGVAVTREPETLARISYQRFFRRYWRLAGMTGTAREARGELWRVYGLKVETIAPHRASRRLRLPTRVFASDGEKWAHVVDRARTVHASGQPLLIGTASLAASEHLSGLLAGADLPHEVLNARQDHAEADIIARAGEHGRITVATSMAGRGTDIRLGDGVAALGGLHVILTGKHDAARIDRQLIGRCARQGDPGSYELVLALDDALLGRAGGPYSTRPVRAVAVWSLGFGSGAASALLRAAQRRTEGCHARLRSKLLRADHRSDDRLVFAGPAE